MNPVAGLEPEVEAQAIDGRHSGFVGGLASKPAGDQTECIGMISIHVLDDGAVLPHFLERRRANFQTADNLPTGRAAKRYGIRLP